MRVGNTSDIGRNDGPGELTHIPWETDVPLPRRGQILDRHSAHRPVLEFSAGSPTQRILCQVQRVEKRRSYGGATGNPYRTLPAGIRVFAIDRE